MTAIQDLDFVAPRDCELVAYGVAHTLIRAGERVRYFGRGEARGWELGVGAGHHERVLIMNCWDSDIGKQLVALRDTRTVDGSESFPDRVLRVAREAGYEPTGAELEEDAHAILFLYRDDYYFKDSEDRGLVEILVGKDRDGGSGWIKMKFTGEYTRFDSLASEPDEFHGDFDERAA